MGAAVLLTLQIPVRGAAFRARPAAILSGGAEGGRSAQTMSCRVGAATCHCKLWSEVLGASPLRVAPYEQVKLDEARMKNFIKG